MTGTDAMMLREILTKLAAELREAPAKTAERATSYAERAGSVGSKASHQAGALEFMCKTSADTLDRLIKIYLPKPKPKDRR